MMLSSYPIATRCNFCICDDRRDRRFSTATGSGASPRSSASAG